MIENRVDTCPKCGSPRAMRQTGCPDGRSGCLVLHSAIYCPTCEEREMKIKNSASVVINGEKCYPHDLIKQLDQAWGEFRSSSYSGAMQSEIEARLLRVRRVLGLI